MSLGNDVVDLADPEARLEGLHPRFAERVFTPAEREILEGSGGERPVLHWALWTAKESAYKALARLAPRTVFAPRAFAVELAGPPGDRVPATGRVRHGSRSFALEVSRQGDALHAVAWDEAGNGAERRAVLREVAAAEGEPGAAVRRVASQAIGLALASGDEPVRIVGRPPVAVGPTGPLDLVLSLSHHGRWVAFAWAAPARSRDVPGPFPRGAEAAETGPASATGGWSA